MTFRRSICVALALISLPAHAATASAAAKKRPDLALKGPSAGLTSVSPARPLSLAVTVTNRGRATAKASSLRGYLARRPQRGATDVRLLGKLPVRTLRPGRRLTIRGTVMVPATTKVGTYRLILCADDERKVRESNERNNCVAMAGTIVVATAGATTIGGGLPSGVPSAPTDLTTPPGPTPPGPTPPGPTPPGPTPPDPTPPEPVLPGSDDPVPPAPDAPAATPLSATAPTSFAGETKFLYQGAGAVQTGVDPQAITAGRAGVLRGRVLQGDGSPLPSVRVTVEGHPELGSTVTRTDGHYDLALNSGEHVTLHFERPTYLPVDRPADPPLRDYDMVDDVVMRRFDEKETPVTTGAGAAQVAVSSTTTDASGSRRANLIFLPDTHATMRLANGSTQALPTTMHVRATEYTVGDRGPDAMPGALPPTSGYTYAADYTVDEAVEAGATRVDFDKPVVVYTDNFIGMPVGTAVPLGSYDTTTDSWRPEANGRVLKITAIQDGMAQVDVDGDGTADSGATTDALGITTAERQQLAGLYEAGTSLWRASVSHFTPWDHNWPYGPPDDADPPNPPKPPKPDDPRDPKDPRDPCQEPTGSSVECDTRALRESLPVAGTPYRLSYNSDRSSARDEHAVDIDLTGATVPASLARVELKVKVAGRETIESFAPAPNLTHRFVWDGRDAYGRLLLHRVHAYVEISFVYPALYRTAGQNQAAFAKLGDALTAVPARQEMYVTQRFNLELGRSALPPAGLGGWTLSPHHALDPIGQVAELGTGDREVAPVAAVSQLLADPFGEITYPDRRKIGQPAWQPDGSVWFPDVLTRAGSDNVSVLRIRRHAPDGTLSTIATFPEAPTGQRYSPVQMVRAPDGGVWVLATIDASTPPNGNPGGVIWHVSPAGTITQVTAGSAFTADDRTDPAGAAGDGMPAHDVVLDRPQFLATGPDGTLYILEPGDLTTQPNRIQRIRPDGMLDTIFTGGPDYHLMESFAVAPDGSIVFEHIDFGGRKIKRLLPSGEIITLLGAGNQTCCTSGQLANQVAYGYYGPVAVLPNGDVVFNTGNSVAEILGDGTLAIIGGTAGDGNPDRTTAAEAAASVPLQDIDGTGYGIAADGRIAISTYNSGLRTIEPGLAGYSFSGYPLPSPDGSQVYEFDAAGRHQRTVDALTGVTLETFGYDTAGRLASVTDRDGRVTSIERNGAGDPTAIVAPGGDRTELAVSAGGDLTSVKRPGVAATELRYGTGGLLTGETDATGGVHTFAYDADGHVTSDTDPDGVTTTVTHATQPAGEAVTLTSPLGHASTYLNGGDAAGGWTRTSTDPAGAQTVAKVAPDGTQSATLADGRVTSATPGPDPRFGALLPIPAKTTVQEPSGLTFSGTTKRTTTLTDPIDLFSVDQLVDTFRAGNSANTVRTYDGSAHTVTVAEGGGARRAIKTLDTKARTTKLSTDAAATDRTFTYDSHGRVTDIQQGAADDTYTYDARDRLTSATDALSHATTFTTDTTGRTASTTLPGGQTYGFEHDGLDRLTQVTMPGGAEHVLTYTAAGRPKAYKPPGSGSGYVIAHDADGQPTSTTLPGGRVEQLGRDAGGRVTSITYHEATVGIGYVGADSRMGTLTRTPSGGGTAATLALGYDGDLLTSIAGSGTASGRYDLGYDANFRLTSSKLTVGADERTTTASYDSDDRLVSWGPFSFTRNGPRGSVSAISGGPLSVSQTWDGLSRVASRQDTVNGTAAYGMALTRDAAGHITQKVETAGGAAHTFTYTYDADGRVVDVARDATATEHYTYDADGNRLLSTIGATTKTATVDPATGRITALATAGGASVPYTVDTDGFLTARGSDSFTYSARGELLSATAGATTRTYRYDAFGRRIAMVAGANTTHYLYGNPDQQLQVTGVIEPDGTVTSLDYTEAGTLFSFLRGSTRYYVSSDQVGSPRVVTDAAGAVVKAITYSAYGQVLADSAPSFDLPLGYAGALPDDGTGLLHMGLRDYEPATGRFTSRDPNGLGGGDANLFDYVGGDPVQLSDPLGLVSAGATLCEGLCVGMKWSITDKGFSACVEGGFGEGIDIEITPDGKLDDNKAYLKGSAELNIGPLAQYELSEEVSSDGHCRKAMHNHKACVVGSCIDKEDGIKVDPGKMADAFKAKGLGLEGKFVGGVCQNILW
ncbi:RHS repeat-associated core domain-containing protein [Baekduia sp.]|uniref:RHS repeat-associated core domain-containing protein n=1 Tax=Baekduia sp. TaxID=2600305 RepID=UPI002E0CEB97|nr:RHS repeat-associated core domain-containing protein [Baekduia sp.]